MRSWRAKGHAVEHVGDEPGRGPFVEQVALCDSPERARWIAHALNEYGWAVATLRAAEAQLARFAASKSYDDGVPHE